MIRKAVGAIVTQAQDVLMVFKTKIMNTNRQTQEIEGYWDFPKGGVLEGCEPITRALFRELYEETGSRDFEIIKAFPDPIFFHFSKELVGVTGFRAQETRMFHVSFTGNRSRLHPQDEEIERIQFFPYEQVNGLIHLDETKVFWKRYCSNLLN